MDKIGKETLTIVEAAEVLGIGITTAYRAAKSGQIPPDTSLFGCVCGMCSPKSGD